MDGMAAVHPGMITSWRPTQLRYCNCLDVYTAIKHPSDVTRVEWRRLENLGVVINVSPGKDTWSTTERLVTVVVYEYNHYISVCPMGSLWLWEHYVKHHTEFVCDIWIGQLLIYEGRKPMHTRPVMDAFWKLPFTPGGARGHVYLYLSEEDVKIWRPAAHFYE